jgi:hypothetical protein
MLHKKEEPHTPRNSSQCTMSAIDDIKNGGVRGCFGLDQMNWGAPAGQFYEFWKCAPQCGAPDVKNCLVCVAHWYLCGPCALSKLYASSLEEECHIIPHCAMACFCIWATLALTRHNTRRKIGVSGNLCGDIVCTWLCGCCSLLQVIRASSVDDWNYLNLKFPPTIAPTIKFLR